MKAVAGCVHLIHPATAMHDPVDFQTADHTQLAERFCRALQGCLTEKQLHQVQVMNDLEHDPMVCHTRDFCDADYAMMEAFKSFGIDPIAADGSFDPDMVHLWHQAWDSARASGFRDPEAIVH